MARKTSKLTMLGCVVVVAALAAGCSSSKKSNSTGGSSTSGAATSSAAATGASSAATGSPIKIGVLAAETGGLAAQYGANGKIAQAFADMVNASGGIGGHQVQIINIDTKADAATYQAGAKQLVENDKVTAIVSADDYAEATAADYLGKSGVPIVGSDGTNLTTWGKLPNYYQVNTSYPYSSTGEIIAGHAAGANSASAIVCAEVANCLSTGTTQKGTASALGMRYDGTLTAAATAPNYQAQCVQVQQNKTAFIALSIPSVTAQRLVPQCMQQGFNGLVGENTEGFVQGQAEKLGASQVVVDLQGFPWWVNDPAVQQYRDAMSKYASGVDYRSGDASNTWEAVMLIKAGLEKSNLSGDVTAATLSAGMSQIKNETLGGLLPQPVSYTAGQPGAPIKCFWPSVLKKGSSTMSVLHVGTSGNGASGDLSSSCDTVTH